jgi:hypothetical protein
VDSSIGIGDLADVAALVTLAGGVIYLLGLLGLAWPIYARITNDGYTAWYAVSLIPRTVVAGHGARIWMRFPLLMTLLLLVLITTVLLLRDAILLIFPSGLGRYIAFAVYGFLCVLCYRLLGASEDRLIPKWFPHLRTENYRGHPLITAASLIGLVAAGLVGILAWTAIDLIKVIPPELEVRWDNTFITTLLLFIASLLLGVPAATSIDPPLPPVKITAKSDDTSTNEGSNPREGLLVTHNDSHWFLFDESNKLLSIPDEQVASVQIGWEADSRTVEGDASTDDPKPE